MSVFQLSNEIRSLPVADRLRLAEEIWNSVVEDEREFELNSQQKKVLLQRIAFHRGNPDSGVAWSELKSDILGD